MMRRKTKDEEKEEDEKMKKEEHEREKLENPGTRLATHRRLCGDGFDAGAVLVERRHRLREPPLLVAFPCFSCVSSSYFFGSSSSHCDFCF